MTITETPALASPPPIETTIHTDLAFPTAALETKTLRLGDGWATLDAATGAPIQFIDPNAPERTFLLEAGIPWHSVEHAWGTGYVIADTFAGRWSTPDSMQTKTDAVTTQHQVASRLEIEVERRGGDTMRETYRFRNVGDQAMRITSLGIQTPFADLYPGASDALRRRVHAHLFTGGAWAWAAAQPMEGAGRILGVTVREGALWGYSVETRNTTTISNARGHMVLHVTDHARNPDAFGGQPVIQLTPGEEYVLAWDLAWYDDMASFIQATAAPARFSSLSATVGDIIMVQTESPVRAAAGVEVITTGDGARLTARTPGCYWVQIGENARTEVLFHDRVEIAVRKRSAYVLAHQLSSERPSLLAHAIVPVDTSTRLTQTTNGWSDWSDGSERIGVAIMLQQGLLRGWLDKSVDIELGGWAQFARTHLIDINTAPRRGSQDQHSGIRLYDSPWLARFFLLRHEQHLRAEDLDLAARLLERAFELGIGRFLTIGFSEIVVDVAAALTHAGDDPRAAALRATLIESARYFIEIGTDLPGHEVAYEQSIIAPLLNLLIDAHRLSGDPLFIDEIRARLPWLTAFGGPQPHARLHGVAVRHWDGYWFGQRRQWGDVFPHYWSALTSTVLLRLPESLRTEESDALGYAILRANMANYFADGSATCAFVMPTSVDGVPAHAADPLANDQDFHLALWMQLQADGYATLA